MHPWQRLHSASQSCGRPLIGLELAITPLQMEIQEIHLRIARIIGLWFTEQEAKKASPVAKALLATGRNLLEASKVLSGHQTGERTLVEIQATTEAVRLLALALSSVQSTQRKLSSGIFTSSPAKMGHTCLVAWADFAQEVGQKGRPALHWYDGFTSLLLDFAKKAGIKASVGRDRVTGERTGWLFQAAQALEPFLYDWMRSKSPEACGKRLERSMRRLRDFPADHFCRCDRLRGFTHLGG